MTTPETPADAIIRQICILQDAISLIQKAIDDTTGSVDPEEASWKDVSRLAMLVDQCRPLLSND